MWPAVPSVVMPARERRAASSSSVSVRGSSSSRSSSMRPMTGGSAARRRAASSSGGAPPTATAGPGSSSSGSAPPPTFADGLHDLAADRRREPLRPGAQRGLVRREHGQDRDLAAGALGVAVELERGLERGEAQLVEPQRPRERVLARRRRRPRPSRPSAPPAGRRAACRPEKQTSAAPARTERRTAGSSRSVSISSASTPEPTSSMTGTPSSHSSSISTSCTNPSWRKLEGCARRIAPVRGPIAAS